jgi:hypothetical protein
MIKDYGWKSRGFCTSDECRRFRESLVFISYEYAFVVTSAECVREYESSGTVCSSGLGIRRSYETKCFWAKEEGGGFVPNRERIIRFSGNKLVVPPTVVLSGLVDKGADEMHDRLCFKVADMLTIISKRKEETINQRRRHAGFNEDQSQKVSK